MMLKTCILIPEWPPWVLVAGEVASTGCVAAILMCTAVIRRLHYDAMHSMVRWRATEFPLLSYSFVSASSPQRYDPRGYGVYTPYF